MPPPPISMFELGQCATPVPHWPSRAISCVVRIDAVRDPRAVAPPSDLLELLDRAPPERLLGERSSSGSSARCVCSRTSSRSASSAVARISSGVTENGEHGASAMRTIAPHVAVVMLRDQPLAVGEDLVVVLHDRVGRQAAVLLRQAHRAARRMEAHAELLRGADLGAR